MPKIRWIDTKIAQFVAGLGLIAFSLLKYNKDKYEIFYILAILVGIYFFLQGIKNER